MASTVLMRDVLWRASTLLQDAKPQFHRATEHDMVDAANDAQVAIAKFLPSACSRIDVVRLQPGTRQSIQAIPAAYCKPGDGSTPALPIVGTQVLDVIRNMGADGLTPGRAIRRASRRMLDAQTPDWHSKYGSVVSSFTYDPMTPLYWYSFPGINGTVWVEMAFTAQPLKIPNTGTAGAELYGFGGGSTQTITIADEHLDDIVNYIVARILLQPSEWADAQKASAFVSLFTGSLNAKVTAVTGHNPNLKQLPFAPEPVGRAS